MTTKWTYYCPTEWLQCKIGLVALQQTTQCNNHQSKQAIKKTKDKLECESKNIAMALTSLAALK